MGDPTVGWIAAIIIGGIAGWLAEQFMKSNMGMIMNIVLGIVGAAIASAILSYFGIVLGGWVGYLISGFIGAILLIWIVRAIRPARGHRGHAKRSKRLFAAAEARTAKQDGEEDIYDPCSNRHELAWGCQWRRDIDTGVYERRALRSSPAGTDRVRQGPWP